MRQAFMLLGIMTLIVFVGGVIAFKQAQVPTDANPIKKNSSHMSLTLTSPAFEDGGLIPSRFTCDGSNVNPEFRISGVPYGTQSFVLVMDDPDIPDSVKQSKKIEKFDHWSVYNIPANTTVIPEAAVIGTDALNLTGKVGYVGPCPPDREHRYFFRLYALSGTLNFVKTPTQDELEIAAQSMELDRATLMGRYERMGNRE